MVALRIVLTVILLLVCLALIVLVLMQSGKGEGLSGAFTGSSQTFFSKTKAKSYEEKLAKYTKYSVVAFVVLSIVLVIIQ